MEAEKSDESVVDLPSFAKAKLHAERVRILCMMGLFGAFVLLGVFRILMPLDGRPSVGWIVFSLSTAFLALEARMFGAIGRELAADRPMERRSGARLAVAECAYPVAVMFLLMLLNPDDRYFVLVSPGYPFLYVLIALSVLRVDSRATASTGLLATLGYGGLVAWALIGANPAGGDLPLDNPHPPALYVNLALMLGLATAAAVFVARQVRGYVVAAVRELETRRQHDRLKRDLEIAGEIQQRLLPATMPGLSGYQFAAVSRPADQTGGDYYDWQEISGRRVVFSLGDVAGHGIGPALVTAACRAYVRSCLGNEPAPSTVLDRVNALLHSDMPEGRFVTLVLVDLDAETHDVTLISAGHGPTLHVRAERGEIRQIESQGLPLGLFDAQTFEEGVRFRLDPGDFVVLCSDGFFEPTDPSGAVFGLQRLTRVIRERMRTSADEILAAMEDSVRAFIGAASQPDDMTAVVIKRTA